MASQLALYDLVEDYKEYYDPIDPEYAALIEETDGLRELSSFLSDQFDQCEDLDAFKAARSYFQRNIAPRLRQLPP